MTTEAVTDTPLPTIDQKRSLLATCSSFDHTRTIEPTSQKWTLLRPPLKALDDADVLETIDPWGPRGIEIRGVAEALGDATPSQSGFAPGLIRIRPTRALSWAWTAPRATAGSGNALAPPTARNVGDRDLL